MDLKIASLLAKYLAKGSWFMVVACFLMISLAGGTYILGGNSEKRSGINQGHDSANVFNVDNAGGHEYHSQVYGMVAASQNPESGKNSIKNLQPAKAESRILIGRDLTGRQGENLWAGERKQLNKQVFIQVYGMIAASQNPESGKNTIKSLLPAKAESHTLIGRDLMVRHGEILWAGKNKQFNKQVSIQRGVSMMESAIKGRRLLEAQKPKPYAAASAQFLEPKRPLPYKGPPASHN